MLAFCFETAPAWMGRDYEFVSCGQRAVDVGLGGAPEGEGLAAYGIGDVQGAGVAGEQ